MTATLKRHSVGNTLVLTISNPEHRNALDPAIYASGVEALNTADRDPEIKSVVLTGEGSHFCAGGQLQRLLGNRQQAPEVQANSIEGLNSWVETIHSFPKPVIAAVEGACAGAGFSLTLACDMVVAASNSVFVMAYANVALSPDGGASWNLVRALPRATVVELLMLGEKLDPQRLHALGLVNRLAAPGQALQTALDLAEKLNRRAPNTLASIKELVQQAPDNSLSQQLKAERDSFVRNLFHPNGAEGIQAFLDKRPPIYQ
jgi:enoyl-CoA hydratase/carnithine racemase